MELILVNKKNGEEVLRGSSRECALFVQRNSNSMLSFEKIRSALLEARKIKNRSYMGFKVREIREDN